MRKVREGSLAEKILQMATAGRVFTSRELSAELGIKLPHVRLAIRSLEGRGLYTHDWSREVDLRSLGKLPERLANDVRSGVEASIGGFAARYGVSPENIQSARDALKKRNVYIGVVGTIHRGKNSIAGILKDNLESVERAQSSMLRDNDKVRALIISLSGFMETATDMYPDLIPFARSLNSNLLQESAHTDSKLVSAMEENYKRLTTAQ